MMRDLFFYIWGANPFISNWDCLMSALFLLCIAFCVFIFARVKAKNKNFTKKHLIFLLISLFIMYQSVPCWAHMRLNVAKGQDKREKWGDIAIKSALIPWQKGGYYITLADYAILDKEFEKGIDYYDKAYSYIKSYKYPCWNSAFLHLYANRNYDAVIEITKGMDHPPYFIIAECYLMQNDLKNAELYIDKNLQKSKKHSSEILAAKAYLLRQSGNTEKATEYYNRAKDKCNNENRIKSIDEIYSDWYKFANNQIDSSKKNYMGLE